MDWKLLLRFRGLCWEADNGGAAGEGAAGGGAAGGGDGAAGGASGGAGGEGGGTGEAAGAAGSAGAAAGAGGEGIEQLRRTYEETKGNLEKWTKLGANPEEVAGHATVGQRLYTQNEAIATKLGYSKEEFREAFNADPAKTMAFLARKAGEQARVDGSKPLTRDELNRLLEEKLGEATKPLEERENMRLAQEADFKVSQTFEKLGQQTFTPEGWKAMPQGEREVLQLVMQEMLAYDEQALVEIKTKGATAPVQKYFQEATKFLDGYYNARLQRETGRAAAANGAGARGNGSGKGEGAATPRGVNPDTKKPWTINELIEDPSRVDAKYA